MPSCSGVSGSAASIGDGTVLCGVCCEGGAGCDGRRSCGAALVFTVRSSRKRSAARTATRSPGWGVAGGSGTGSRPDERAERPPEGVERGSGVGERVVVAAGQQPERELVVGAVPPVLQPLPVRQGVVGAAEHVQGAADGRGA